MRDPLLPLVFTRADAVRAGATDHTVTHRQRTGAWAILRRGAMALATDVARATPEQRHLMTVLACSITTPRPDVISHLSAALAYGWSGPLDLAEAPTFTVPPASDASTRRRRGVVRQVAPLPEGHLWERAGLRLTSPIRTVADCLRHYPAQVAVPLADNALRNGVDWRGVCRVLGWQASWPYHGRGIASAVLVDGRRESWLESVSAVAFHRHGLPEPQPQVCLFDESGQFLARVDFAWAEAGVLGEPDGWGKYADAPMDRLRSEKVREDSLRDLGYEVVRWGTSDALQPDRRLIPALARAFRRADPGRLRGSQVPSSPPLPRPSIALTGLDDLASLAQGRALTSGPSYARYDENLAG